MKRLCVGKTVKISVLSRKNVCFCVSESECSGETTEDQLRASLLQTIRTRLLALNIPGERRFHLKVLICGGGFCGKTEIIYRLFNLGDRPQPEKRSLRHTRVHQKAGEVMKHKLNVDLEFAAHRRFPYVNIQILEYDGA